MVPPSIPQIPPNNQPASPNQVEPDIKKAGSTEYQLRNKLLLLATLVATVTYAAGINLPGGVWQDTQDGHTAGDLILHDTHYNRYLAFYYCNATAFAASLVVCLLLLVNSKSEAWAAALRVVMVLDLLGLMGGYAAGSCRDAFTTIYSSVIMSAVFLYIVIAFSVSVFSYRDSISCCQKKDTDKEKGHVKQEENQPEDQHEVLMLLATFVITITYVAGLNPPGGFWSDSQDGNRVSDPILQDHSSSRYQAFFVCNTTAFVSSIFIVMLLLDKKKKLILLLEKMLCKKSVRIVALYGFIVVALLGLVGAYAAGSCRELETTSYVVSLIGAVLLYIFLQVAITKAINKKPPATEVEREVAVVSCNSTWLSLLTRSCYRSLIRDNKALEKGEANEALEKSKTDKSLEKPKETPGKAKVAPQNGTVKEALEKARNLVVLLATLVASITYSAGLDPPGGLWQDDQDGHKIGDPILLTTHPARYKVFFYSNSAAFVASLIVITMVRSKSLLQRHTLEAAMLLDLFGLIGAYAAGSCREVSTSIYVLALAGAVLVYVVIHIVFFTLDDKDNQEGADKLEKDKSDQLDNRREVLLLLAILVAALTYQAGLTPPGGFWSADDNLGHHAGFPVLLDNYPHRYMAFFYCNGMSFMASVALIVLLVNPNLYRPGIRCYALYVCMVAGMFGLMGAYAAGSSRNVRTSIYVLTLVAAVFAFVILQVVIFWIRYPKTKAAKQVNKCFKVVIDWIRNQKTKAAAQVANSSGNASPAPTDGPSPSGQASGVSPEITEGNSDTGHPNEKTEKEVKDDKDLREYLMLLGVLAASVTYQTGLKPPGGLWENNDNGHTAGNSILHDTNRSRYHAFFYSNSTSFMASIVVVILLLPWTLHEHKLPLWPMHTAILLNMLGLLVAYAAGSTRDWETSRNVICLVIPVLVCIAIYAACSVRKKKKEKEEEKKEEKKKQSQIRDLHPPTIDEENKGVV